MPLLSASSASKPQQRRVRCRHDATRRDGRRKQLRRRRRRRLPEEAQGRRKRG